MAITHAEVIRFSNEVIRPKAEKLRALKAEIDSDIITWFSSISGNCPNDSGEILDDGREVDGVSVLNGADINSVVNVLLTIQTAFDAPGVVNVIAKPCVRPLTVID